MGLSANLYFVLTAIKSCFYHCIQPVQQLSPYISLKNEWLASYFLKAVHNVRNTKNWPFCKKLRGGHWYFIKKRKWCKLIICTKDFSIDVKSFCLLEERRNFLPRGIPHLKSIFSWNEIIWNKLHKCLCFNCFQVLKYRLYLTHKCFGHFITLS